MEAGVSPLPLQIAEMRNRSVSKQAQHPFPKFKRIPRGVRLLLGKPSPSFRASNTDEKNGKLVSTKSAHEACAGMASGALPGSSAANEEPEKRNQARPSKEVGTKDGKLINGFTCLRSQSDI